MLAAVNLGDDADTTAAIYGQLAGAIYGLDGIPERWRARACTAARRSSRWPTPCYDLDHSRPAIAHFAHVRPSRVVACETPEQVAEAIRTSDRRVAIRSGGHCFAGRSTTDRHADRRQPDGPMCGSTESWRRSAPARGSARSTTRSPPTAARSWPGAARPSGSPGSTLGGGIGILGRMHGLTCDQLVAAQVVLARRPDRAHRRPPGAAVGAARRRRRALRRRHGARLQDGARPERIDRLRPRSSRGRADVVAQWQRDAPDAPEALAASLLVLDDHAHVFGAYIGPRAAAEQLLAAFGGDGRIEELEFRAAKQWLADNGPDDGRERPFSPLRVLHAADRPAARLQARLHAARRRVQRPSRPTRPPTRTATRASACTSRPPTRRRSTA